MEEIDGFATITFRSVWPEEERDVSRIEYDAVKFSTAEQREMERRALLEQLDEPPETT